MALSLYLNASNRDRIEKILKSPARRRFSHKNLKEGLSVILLNLDRPDLIIPLLEQLLEEKKSFDNSGLFFEIIIGDTGSKDSQVLQAYKKFQNSNIKIITDLEYHFSKNNNELAFNEARAQSLLFLNNDVVLDPSKTGLIQLYNKLHSNDSLAVVGAYLFFPDRSLQHAGIAFVPDGLNQYLPYHPLGLEKVPQSLLKDRENVAAVTGACLMIRTLVFESLNGFDEEYKKECQDVDLCLGAQRLGFQVSLTNCGSILHFENATRPKGDLSLEDRSRFLRYWSSYIEAHKL